MILPLDPSYLRAISGGTAINITAMIQFLASDQGAKTSRQAIATGRYTEALTP